MQPAPSAGQVVSVRVAGFILSECFLLEFIQMLNKQTQIHSTTNGTNEPQIYSVSDADL